jgi:hypothetical protein
MTCPAFGRVQTRVQTRLRVTCPSTLKGAGHVHVCPTGLREQTRKAPSAQVQRGSATVAHKRLATSPILARFPRVIRSFALALKASSAR